jgi:putative transposase
MKERDFIYKGHRNSYTELNQVYFWTITINKWHHLLQDDDYKMIIVNSLQWLFHKQLVQVYGYIIMPNHIHLMWNQLKMNGREFPKNSFEKFTAKMILNNMQRSKDPAMQKYAVGASDRQYNVWQRDPLAIRIFSREMAEQKLRYIHNNALQVHWALCSRPEEYRFSSSAFYESGIDEFNLLTHYLEVF